LKKGLNRNIGILIFGIISATSLLAQESTINIYLGLGIYESAFIGGEFSINNKNTVGFSTGTNFNINKHSFYSFSLEENYYFLSLSQNRFKLGSAAKIIFWAYEDNKFLFNALGLTPELKLNAKLSSRVCAEFALGPIFNVQLKSERKNFEAIGWPKKISTNSSMRLLFRF